MSESETLPAGIHPEAALLPWYANNTLAAEERLLVARHLESCSDCRRELDELVHLKQDLLEAYRAQPAPSPRIAQSVLTSVRQEMLACTGSRRSGSWIDTVDQWFRSLFLPQWVPTLAAVLLMTQLGLLIWVTFPPTPSEQITTRSVGSPPTRFRVIFQEQATEGQIRGLLLDIRGRIVDGPDSQQAYAIELSPGDQTNAEKLLQMLRASPGVVLRAESIAP